MSLQNPTLPRACPRFKVILLGDLGVGKTSFFLRVRDDLFQEVPLSTVGVESCTKRLVTTDGDIQISLCDTAGAEKFRTLTRNFYRNAHAVLLMFSLDDPATLFYLSKWVQDAREYAPTALRFLVGNKADSEKLVTRESMEGFAMSHNCESAFVVSAKSGLGIPGLLTSLSEKLTSSHKKETFEQENSWLTHSVHVNAGNNEAELRNKSSCC